MNQRLYDLYQNDGVGKNRRWTFLQVIERLKSIRSQVVGLGGVDLSNISTLDEEQKMLLDACGADKKLDTKTRGIRNFLS